MSDSNQKGKKKVSKGLIAIIIAAVVLVGGSVAAMMFIDSSPKVSYFKAESDSANFLTDQLKERYAQEYDWYNKTVEEPTESTIELAANYNVPPTEAAFMDPAQIINNSTLTILTQSDMENKEASAGLSANIGGLSIDGLNFYVNAEEILLQTPFVNELLQIKDEEIGPLLYELDPNTFTGEETFDFEAMFETEGTYLQKEDMEYIEEEYVNLLYEEISEDAFTSTNETVEVNGESIKADKIEMLITEEHFKELVTLLLDKMKDDERMKEIIKEQMMYSQFGGVLIESEIDEMLADYESNIEEAKKGIADFQIPNGLNSTIWVNDGLVVQRDFSIDFGMSADDLVNLSVTGSQLLTATSQWFDYEFSYADIHEEGSFQLQGDLNWEDNKGDDTVTLTAADTILTYVSTETLNDGSRDFERSFNFNDGIEDASLLWNGVANYNNDQMDSEHTVTVSTVDIPEGMVELQLNLEGQVIDGVELPEDENIRNLGTMSTDELYNYFETEFYPALEEWMYGLLMGGGF